MIEVTISTQYKNLASVRIRNTEVHPDDTADYVVEFSASRGTALGFHKRTVHNFPRKKYNVLALVLQALNTLDPKELELEEDYEEKEEKRTMKLLEHLFPRQREKGDSE